MGFVKSLEEIAAHKRESVDFFDAEMLTVVWETKPEIIERLLPSPLKPASDPIAVAFVGWYPKTNFGVAYHESALFIRASYDSVEGNYCLSMPVSNDIALAGGREIFGFPKKMANFHFKKDGDVVSGWTERKGVRFMELETNLTGTFNDVAAMEKFMLAAGGDDGTIRGVSYNFKHFIAPGSAGSSAGFDYNPRLVRQETILRPKAMQFGEASVTLTHSEDDPWAEVEVVKVLGAMYTVGDNSMLGGTVVAETDATSFAPYAYLKWDKELK